MHAVVTGGAVRLGAAISRALGQRGCSVTVHCHGSRDAAEALVATLPAGSRVLQADLRDPGALERFADVVTEAQPPDLLVLSAASFVRARLRETSPAEFDEILALNLRAPVWLAAHIGETMRARGGAIVLVSDAAGLVLWPGYGAHSIAKAALHPAVELLARELSPEVRVNAVAPGPVLAPVDYDEQMIRRSTERTLLKRMGTPQDVAEAVCFLALDASYVTGAVLPVDGGRHAER
ncbi:MAG: SDR family oxidoreductase [Candidatus Dadabacteria bacterium]|nr:MAG: SDR family oxidoreductase [Candidatus Dadabacteria bacterium]